MLPLLPLLLLLLFPHAAQTPPGSNGRGGEVRSELRLLVRLVAEQASEPETSVVARTPARQRVFPRVFGLEANAIPRPIRRTVRDRDGPISV